MKSVLQFILIGVLLFTACGETAEEKGKREQAVIDSISNVYKAKEQSIVDSISRVYKTKISSESLGVNETPKLLHVSNVSYSNSLSSQAGNTYEAINLCDGNNTTAWAVNLDNSAIYDCDKLYGPIVYVKCKKLCRIVIRNGYGKNETSYKNNSRAAKITLLNFNNEEVLIEKELKDIMAPQTIEIPESKGNSNLSAIWIIFDTEHNDGIYKGNKWNDLCISEIEFWGIE